MVPNLDKQIVEVGDCADADSVNNRNKQTAVHKCDKCFKKMCFMVFWFYGLVEVKREEKCKCV